MKTIPKYTSLLFLVFLLVISGCASKSSSEETIKIGVTLTLTGFGAPWGEDIQKGIDLAVKEVNNEGGVNNKQIEVIYEDIAELDLKAAASAAQKFTSVDNVDIIFTQWAEDNEVVWPIAAENNLVVINLASGSRDVPKSSPLVFMIRPTDDSLTTKLVDYTLAQGTENPAMIVEQSAYFESLSTLTNEIWNEKTGKNIKKLSAIGGEKDYKTHLTKIKEGNHDAIFVFVLEDRAGLVLKTAGELGIDMLKLGFTGADDPVVLDVARESAEDLVYPDFAPSEEFFIEKFEEAYGNKPEVAADLAYDAIKVIAKVMQEHGTSTEEIQEGLQTIKDFPGASGPITINEQGERIGKEVVLKVIKNGKGIPLEE